MPHLSIEYSANLDPAANLDALCARLHRVLIDSGLFETGAIRVRARPCPHYAIADLMPANGFADMILRIGEGRPAEDRARIGAALIEAARHHFASLLAEPHFALSLEVQEISAACSWKINAIHPRLRNR